MSKGSAATSGAVHGHGSLKRILSVPDPWCLWKWVNNIITPSQSVCTHIFVRAQIGGDSFRCIPIGMSCNVDLADKHEDA